MTIVNVFSMSVVADMLPNPMLVIVLSVKYNDVTYLERSSGPPSGLVQLLRVYAVHVYGISMCSAVRVYV
jgi:hypothetical protein